MTASSECLDTLKGFLEGIGFVFVETQAKEMGDMGDRRLIEQKSIYESGGRRVSLTEIIHGSKVKYDRLSIYLSYRDTGEDEVDLFDFHQIRDAFKNDIRNFKIDRLLSDFA